jgi:hypothetical protein
MAIADWLNPATPQPSYLTSRAMGVVVPEYFKAATEVRKAALGVAGQEQSLRLNEEQALRAREEERRRREEEAATAAVMPILARLDPTKPTYFRDLSQVMTTTPGAANALASRSVQSFLDISGGARNEQLRLEDAKRSKKDQKEAEKRREKEQVAAEERALARGSNEGVLRLAEKYALELDDESFLEGLGDKIAKVKTPAERSALARELTSKASQTKIKNDLLGYGLDAKEVEALKDKGRFGDRARAKLGKLTQQVSPTTRYRATVRQLMDDIEGERDKKKKDALREKLNRVLDGEELDVNDTVGELLPRTPGKKSVTDKL